MTEPRISSAVPTSHQIVKMIQEEAAVDNALQIESEEDLNQFFELSLFNPMVQAQRFRNFKEIQSSLSHKLEETETAEEKKVLAVEKIDEIASRFQRNNFELNARTLQILRGRITAQDTPEEILDKV